MIKESNNLEVSNKNAIELKESLLPAVDRIAALWPSAAEVMRQLLLKTSDNPELRAEWLHIWRTKDFPEWPIEFQDLVFEVEKNFGSCDINAISRREALLKMCQGGVIVASGHAFFSGSVAKNFATNQLNEMMTRDLSDIIFHIDNIVDPKARAEISELFELEKSKYIQIKTDYTLPYVKDIFGLVVKSFGGYQLYSSPAGTNFSEEQVIKMFQKVEAYAHLFREIASTKLDSSNFNLEFEISRFCKFLISSSKSPVDKIKEFYDYLNSGSLTPEQRSEVIEHLPEKPPKFTYNRNNYFRFILSNYKKHPDEFDALIKELQLKLDVSNPAKYYKSYSSFNQEQRLEIHKSINLLFGRNIPLGFTEDSYRKDVKTLLLEIELRYSNQGYDNRDEYFELFFKELQSEKYFLSNDNPLKKSRLFQIINRYSILDVIEDSVASKHLKLLATESLSASILFATLLEVVPDPEKRLEYLNIIRNKEPRNSELNDIIEKSVRTFLSRREGVFSFSYITEYLISEFICNANIYVFDCFMRGWNQADQCLNDQFASISDFQIVLNTKFKHRREVDIQNILTDVNKLELKLKNTIDSLSSVNKFMPFMTIPPTVVQATLGAISIKVLTRGRIPEKEARLLINAAEEVMKITYDNMHIQ